MATRSSPARRLTAFESCRHELVALAYRMLGDLGRAEDMVQEAWLRWQNHDGDVESPKAFLVTIVTRLCLNELGSARARREENRSDRLPEPIDLDEGGIFRVERLEQISMAFLVVLQRLTPAERAVLLLHDVFDFGHQEIAELVGNNAPACRKLLERARQSLATERRMLLTSPEEHRRLLEAFLRAAAAGDTEGLVQLLADDATLVSDGGAEGRRLGGLRNLPLPLQGAAGIAAFVVATTARTAGILRIEEHELNGQPAIVFWTGERPFAALLLAVADGKIQRVFFHADLRRLRYLGRRERQSSPLVASSGKRYAPPMRILHTMIRVSNLEESLAFYTEVLGMKLLRRKDYDSGRFTLAFVGYGDEASSAVLELTYNWDTQKYDLGNAFGHVAIGTPDIYKTCEEVRRRGGKIVREPGPMKHGTSVIAFVEDPSGYKIELIQTADP